MRILLCSYYYPPDINPIAFRTEALIKEFLRRGAQVDLFIPGTVATSCQQDNLRVFAVGNSDRGMSRQDKKLKKAFLSIPGFSYLDKWRKYFFYSQNKYGRELTTALLAQAAEHYDLVISLDVPLLVHEGVGNFIKRGKCKMGCTIADCSDPIYAGSDHKYSPLVSLREKQALAVFDYVTVRLQAAVPAFSCYRSIDRIKVISQGYDFADIKLGKYSKNAVPSFAYAGKIYEHMRNPYRFFQYLQKLGLDFHFYLYLDANSQKIVQPYLTGLKDKVKITAFLPRKELLPKLATMDFLINFANINRPQQLPSKIIDYAFTGRPILDVNCDDFNAAAFDEFLQGNYDQQMIVDWRQHNICTIAEQFLNLAVLSPT